MCRYLQRIKLIFYHEKKGIIVADTQIFLDILGDLAFYYYDLLQNPDRPVAIEYKWNRFIRHGVLHASCMGEYRNRYVTGVFGPKDALDMMVELGVFVDLAVNEEYLMPCLLNGEEFAYTGPEPSSQALPPLVIEFPGGGPLPGLYYDLAHRVSDKWGGQALNRLGNPHNLSRNCIYFQTLDNYPGMVCLSDPLSSFLLVSYHCSPEIASEICHKICRGLLELIERCCSSSSSSSSSSGRQGGDPCDGSLPRVTFLCPCKTTPIHPAVMSSGRGYLTCPYGLPGFEAVSPEHMIWLKGTYVVCDMHVSCMW